MLFRSQLEKVLPVNDNEKRLTKTERRVVFRGDYLWPAIIESVTLGRNSSRKTKDAYPSEVKITRTSKSGNHRFTETNWRGEEVIKSVEELQVQSKLGRANRVERIARRIKTVALGAAAIGAVAAIIAISPANSGESKSGEACEEVITGEETLTPISSDDLIRVEKAGGTTCELAGQDYLVVGQN